eukprot:Amastigsp_a850875_111.p2 type:complete len:158 gc:universal Amastigsp_a850875_111:555-82(-)
MAEHLTEDEISRFKEVFALIDRDADGTVSAGELRAMMQSCGIGASVSEAEFLAVVNETDVDKLGRLDYPQFLEAMGALSKKGPALDAENDAIFAALDSLGPRRDGLIDIPKLTRLMTALGETMKEEEYADMISHATGGESKTHITFEQFLNFVRSEN